LSFIGEIEEPPPGMNSRGAAYFEVCTDDYNPATRDERTVSNRTIDSHIKKLRRKIDAADPKIALIH
jgi:hypothetical protein